MQIKKEHQDRGQVTTRIKNKSKELLGYEITETELRFMVYVHYESTNNQSLAQRKIDAYEIPFFDKWIKQKYILGTMNNFKPSKKFWDILNELIYLAYVDIT